MVDKILVATDEEDVAWLDEVRAMGWTLVDHVSPTSSVNSLSFSH